jgi:hypothetical protein
VKIVRHVMKNRLRPSTLASHPLMGSTTALDTRYEVGIQGALVSTRSKIAADVGKRNVGDACVENLHERCRGDYDADQPRVELRLPLGRHTRRHCLDRLRLANGASVFVGLVAITLKPEAC